MEVSAIPNDTRGWIMTVVSGIACTIGASIICVDLIIRHVPGKKDFKLEQSNVFTAASMSLSFGVMAFTSLYGMLPSSKNYLLEGGMAPSRAAWTVIGCFVAGFVGIQIAMRIIHKWMPSHVVDCEHTHDESKANVDGDHVRGRESHRHVHGYDGTASETSPLLPTHENGHGHRKLSHRPSLPLLREESGPPVFVDSPSRQQSGTSSQRPSISVTVGRRPSIQDVGNRVMSFVKDKKTNCDSAGPCFGYSEPCGQECLKNKVTLHLTPSIGLLRKATSNRRVSATPTASTHEENLDAACSHNEERESGRSSPDYLSKSAPDLRNVDEEAAYFDMNGHHEGEAQHHHHVPQNAFLSIGLQTTIAIALHKLPEGFITYATNHANPALGLAVFMALFIHNVTEGFAMALPLYLALGNRWKAMLWSSLLGGISQPLGAGIAALWFTLAGNTNKPGEKLYGCMFAITAGLMTSVALGLFIEGLSQTHNRNLCTFFALVGMAIMGCSNALTA